jgi:hypothetical protein
MSYFWNFINKRKESDSQQQIYLDIEQIPVKKTEEQVENESSHVIIDLFADEE